MRSSLGIDYGTNSVRALIVVCSNAAELGSGGMDYSIAIKQRQINFDTQSVFGNL